MERIVEQSGKNEAGLWDDGIADGWVMNADQPPQQNLGDAFVDDIVLSDDPIEWDARSYLSLDAPQKIIEYGGGAGTANTLAVSNHMSNSSSASVFSESQTLGLLQYMTQNRPPVKLVQPPQSQVTALPASHPLPIWVELQDGFFSGCWQAFWVPAKL